MRPITSTAIRLKQQRHAGNKPNKGVTKAQASFGEKQSRAARSLLYMELLIVFFPTDKSVLNFGCGVEVIFRSGF
jgi:hypothetical protein